MFILDNLLSLVLLAIGDPMEEEESLVLKSLGREIYGDKVVDTKVSKSDVIYEAPSRYVTIDNNNKDRQMVVSKNNIESFNGDMRDISAALMPSIMFNLGNSYSMSCVNIKDSIYSLYNIWSFMEYLTGFNPPGNPSGWVDINNIITDSYQSMSTVLLLTHELVNTVAVILGGIPVSLNNLSQVADRDTYNKVKPVVMSEIRGYMARLSEIKKQLSEIKDSDIDKFANILSGILNASGPIAAKCLQDVQQLRVDIDQIFDKLRSIVYEKSELVAEHNYLSFLLLNLNQKLAKHDAVEDAKKLEDERKRLERECNDALKDVPRLIEDYKTLTKTNNRSSNVSISGITISSEESTSNQRLEKVMVRNPNIEEEKRAIEERFNARISRLISEHKDRRKLSHALTAEINEMNKRLHVIKEKLLLYNNDGIIGKQIKVYEDVLSEKLGVYRSKRSQLDSLQIAYGLDGDYLINCLATIKALAARKRDQLKLTLPLISFIDIVNMSFNIPISIIDKTNYDNIRYMRNVVANLVYSADTAIPPFKEFILSTAEWKNQVACTEIKSIRKYQY